MSTSQSYTPVYVLYKINEDTSGLQFSQDFSQSNQNDSHSPCE